MGNTGADRGFEKEGALGVARGWPPGFFLHNQTNLGDFLNNLRQKGGGRVPTVPLPLDPRL